MQGLSRSGERRIHEVISRNIEDYQEQKYGYREKKKTFCGQDASAWLD